MPSSTKKQSTTPMMQQYMATKEQYSDCLLFYRMGDFYELFFEDAITAAGALDIALTKRGKNGDEDIAMCGVPHHSYRPYLQRLIEAGYKVAICEQLETPEQARKRGGYKAVVKREVVRIVTPGTVVEEDLLDGSNCNYLLSLVSVGGSIAIAWIDISTGEFCVSSTSKESLASDLARLQAKEILLPEKLFSDELLSKLFYDYNGMLSPQANSIFDSRKCEDKVKAFYEIQSIESLGTFSRAEISACGSLLEYVELTQKGALPRLSLPQKLEASNFLSIDAATRKSLEITKTLAGEKKGSLLSIIDKTLTNSGARLLHNYIAAPLVDPEIINERLDVVDFFVSYENLRSEVREVLKRVADIERALSRVCIDKALPRDLSTIRSSLDEVSSIVEIMQFSEEATNIASIVRDVGNLKGFDDLVAELQSALRNDLAMQVRDGGYIRGGYNEQLDQLRELSDNSKVQIEALRDKYRSETGVNNLKITHNNVLGYFVEVTPTHNDKITDSKFIHRQTLASAVRYTTDELKQLESDITGAKDQSLKLEMEIFAKLCALIVESSEAIANMAMSVARLDVFCALAHLAVSNDYVRPLVDSSFEFNIAKGRHPVVENSLKDEFVANDINLGREHYLWLLTGPNMAGKSTFLRQNAVIAILAQIGSFVPAGSAHIGVVDKLFSRVGASDDLAKGRSTFMVEMLETATIVNQSTERSLVILDEIGRGTSTYDGLSIAWSVLEYLHSKNKSRALFATHYHELTSLVGKLKHLDCYTMRVREWQDNVVFLHEVVRGAADRSYGIHVAKLAGMPKATIARAREILAALQQNSSGKDVVSACSNMPLFSPPTSPDTEIANDNIVIEKLHNTNIDELSPKEALEFLYELKSNL